MSPPGDPKIRQRHLQCLRPVPVLTQDRQQHPVRQRRKLLRTPVAEGCQSRQGIQRGVGPQPLPEHDRPAAGCQKDAHLQRLARLCAHRLHQ